MTLIADGFLAGSLMTLLLPVALLLALVVWYLKFLRRVPETEEREEPTAAHNPGPDATPAAAPYPGSAAPGAVPPSGTSRGPGEL